MSWFQENREPGFFNSLCFRVLKSGNVPQHVAFIMDGNRRFARKINVEKQVGHSKGFDKLAEVLYWCFEVGIPEVTVYAFSTENFNRSESEVKGLMTLAKEKFDRLMEEKDKIMKYGVSVRVIGDVNLLPDDVKLSIARAVDYSKNNTRSVLNVALAYASRHEITEAIKEIAIGVKEGAICESDINELLIEQCLYTKDCRDVDLLVRTSGEIRLSDFLMWQSSYSMLSFVDDLWPEFSIWQFFKCILSYQLGYDTLNEKRVNMKFKQKTKQLTNDMENAHKKIIDKLRKDGESNPELKITKKQLNEEVENYAKERQDRVKGFLTNLDYKRNVYIKQALSGEFN